MNDEIADRLARALEGLQPALANALEAYVPATVERMQAWAYRHPEVMSGLSEEDWRSLARAALGIKDDDA